MSPDSQLDPEHLVVLEYLGYLQAPEPLSVLVYLGFRLDLVYQKHQGCPWVLETPVVQGSQGSQPDPQDQAVHCFQHLPSIPGVLGLLSLQSYPEDPELLMVPVVLAVPMVLADLLIQLVLVDPGPPADHWFRGYRDFLQVQRVLVVQLVLVLL